MLREILSKLGKASSVENPAGGEVPGTPETAVEAGVMPPLDGESSNAGPRSCGFTDAVFAGWYNVSTGELFKGFGIGPEDVVLDVGCGDGGNTLFCARRGAHVIFSDLEAKKVAQLAQGVAETPARGATPMVSDTNPLPLPGGVASRVIAMEMLEHTESPPEILKELVRVGSPGALYLLSVPDPAAEKLQQGIAPPAYFQAPNHVRIFEREEFKDAVEQSGLTIERYTTAGFYWTLWMSFFWLSQKAEGKDVDGAVLDTIKPPYHRLLETWSHTWYQLLCLPGGDELKRKLDQQLPKTQIIVARKPF